VGAKSIGKSDMLAALPGKKRRDMYLTVDMRI